MNILFLTITNISSINDRGIYTDLLRKFNSEEHNVYIVSPYERRFNKATVYVKVDNVNYLKIRIGNIQKTNTIEKGISTLLIEYQFLNAIKEYYDNVKFDLIIYSTPPITFDKVIRYIKKRDNAKSYLLLKDIFPQNAVDLGMFTNNSLIYKFFRRKEISLYNNSDYIGCMSQANVDYILKHNDFIDSSKVEICPNSIEPVNIEKSQEEINTIKIKYDIPLDKVIFIYGGNLGKPQGIDFLIECLKTNESNDKIYFVIVGSGTEFNKLNSYVSEYKPQNVSLFSQLPKNDYDTLVNSCDVGMIFLDKRFTIPNFPSRILSYMQASIPVLAVTDNNTDVGQVITDGQFGLWLESGNVQNFNDSVIMLCDEEVRIKMGNNARLYLENNYTTEKSYEIILRHFRCM